jgi:hypothetical protein
VVSREQQARGPDGTPLPSLGAEDARKRELVTLRQWAGHIDRTWGYLHWHVVTRPGFPAPVGIASRGRGRNGGGLLPYLYALESLNQFRRTQDDLWGRRATRVITGRSPDDRVSLAEFGELAAADTADPGGIPEAGPDGLWPLGELAAWQDSRPPWAGPRMAVTSLGREHLLTRYAFSKIIMVDPKTVRQYTAHEHFPGPAAEENGAPVYRLGDLADFWNSRPGKAPARSSGTGR